MRVNQRTDFFFLLRYEDAWDIGVLLADSNQWIKAANAALNDYRLDFGISIGSYLMFMV